jgi:hypothetical protein
MYDQATNSKNLGWASVILAALLGFFVHSVPAVIAAGAALGFAKFAEDAALFALQAKTPEAYRAYLSLREWFAYSSILAVVASFALSLIKSWG